MANEYLQRTATSSGNRRTWTLALWLKRNIVYDDTGADVIFNAANTAVNSHGTDIRFRKDNTGGNGWNFYDYNANAFTWGHYGSVERRDCGNWFHAMFVFDSTESTSSDRVRVYINGVLDNNYQGSPGTDPSQDYESYVNSITDHYIGVDQFGGSLTTSYSKSQFADIFLVDGQALTPDVFGFFKDGNGYISSGSTMSTDFRPGQWVPKKPSVIKNSINNSGGFGVNGFYLPMNDSSNFGADFHCDPNSIITLKGEDLPQPRNGAPTTTDAYVSQLRSDPYAANLVLAVPGISTSTSANLITNGTFDSDVSNWTGANGTISWSDGQLLVTSGGSGNGYAYQSFTTVIGERYTVNFDYTTGTGGLSLVWIGTTAGGNEVALRSDITTSGNYNISFTATATTTFIRLGANVPTASLTYYYDNIVVKQEDAPRDYSADIKGSGTNKTLTANGNAGVGYELGNYYGSAMTFDGADATNFSLGNDSDFDFGSDDFTIELWRSRNDISSTESYFTKYDNGETQSFWFGNIDNGRDGFWWYDTDGTHFLRTASGIATVGQFDHLCAERHNGTVSLYMNGVPVGVSTLGQLALNVTTHNVKIGANDDDGGTTYYPFDGEIQDLRVYKGVAKYKGGFDVPKPYRPVGIATWRAVPDCTANNFATLNQLGAGTGTFTDGNLTYNSSSDTGNATIGISTGNFYFEARVSNASPTNGFIGIMEATVQDPQRGGGWVTHGAVAYKQDGDQYFKAKGSGTSSSTAFGDSYTTGDIIGVACDVTNNTVTFYKNGVSQGTTSQGPSSIQSNGTFTPLVYGNTVEWNVNFGQNPSFSGTTTAGTNADNNGKGLFKYAPPSGFLALCEDNLPAPAIADPGDYFKTVLWTGSGSSRAITDVGFQPDLVWVKSRVNPASGIFNSLYDSVRKAPFALYSNSNDSEDNPGGTANPAITYGGVSSFDDNGFSIMSGDSDTQLNNSGTPYVAWCWKAGAGTTSTNTDGSIDSVVSVNQDAGFSIVSWTSDGTSLTVGHGLNKAPSFIIQKQRDAAANWTVYHKDLAATEIVELNSNGAKQTSSDFGNTRPTSSVLSSNTTGVNGRRIIAYCWAEVEGFSKFGYYKGNANADGTFVYCGFKPALVITKRTDGTSSWLIHDSSRDPENPVMRALYANEPDAEGSAVRVDFVSNGFKHRNSDGGTANNYANDYIFIAFAESPFKTANAK